MPGRPGTACQSGAPDTGISVAELPIEQVARRAEVEVQTVRYYERRGLLPPPRRRHSGQRLHESATIDLLRVVKTAQRLGFTLIEIGHVFSCETEQQYESFGQTPRAVPTSAHCSNGLASVGATLASPRSGCPRCCSPLTCCAVRVPI